MSPTAIEVSGLRKSYAGHDAVRGIDFAVAEGEVFGFLGTNGAGKTTTIEILEGYRRRTAGEVAVLGLDPARPTRAWRNRIGLVLQESELDPLYTVHETVRLFSWLYARPRGVDDTIALVGLSDKARARVDTLSGGQRRRLDVAVALIGDPDLVFLDEPTTGFDPGARREFWAVIEGLAALGKTIFLTTHYMDEAQHLAGRVAIMRAGRIVAIGTPDEIGAGGGPATTVVRFTLPEDVAPERAAAAAQAPVEMTGREGSLRTGDTQRTLTLLLEWARRDDVALTGLDVRRPSLEDAFLDLTRDEEHDDG